VGSWLLLNQSRAMQPSNPAAQQDLTRVEFPSESADAAPHWHPNSPVPLNSPHLPTLLIVSMRGISYSASVGPPSAALNATVRRATCPLAGTRETTRGVTNARHLTHHVRSHHTQHPHLAADHCYFQSWRLLWQCHWHTVRAGSTHCACAAHLQDGGWGRT
jgi:hypothetical protein